MSPSSNKQGSSIREVFLCLDCIAWWWFDPGWEVDPDGPFLLPKYWPHHVLEFRAHWVAGQVQDAMAEASEANSKALVIYRPPAVHMY